MQRSVCIAEFRMILAVGAAMGQYFCYVRFVTLDDGGGHCQITAHSSAEVSTGPGTDVHI